MSSCKFVHVLLGMGPVNKWGCAGESFLARDGACVYLPLLELVPSLAWLCVDPMHSAQNSFCLLSLIAPWDPRERFEDFLLMTEYSKTTHSLYILTCFFPNSCICHEEKWKRREQLQNSLTFEFLTLCSYLSNEILFNLPYRCLWIVCLPTSITANAVYIKCYYIELYSVHMKLVALSRYNKTMDN